MVASTGRRRVSREDHQAPGHVLVQPGENPFPHPDPRAALAAVMEQVAVEGMSLEEELDLVKNKVKETLETDEKTGAEIRKLGRDCNFLKNAVLSQHSQEHLE